MNNGNLSDPFDVFNFNPVSGKLMLPVKPTLPNIRKDEDDNYFFINPKPGAGVFIQDEKGRILFGKRQIDPAKGKLGIPGGFIDKGESAEETIVREVFEEVGIKIEPKLVDYVGSLPGTYDSYGIRYSAITMFYKVKLPDGAKIIEGDDFGESVWLLPDEVDIEDIGLDNVKEMTKVFLSEVE